MKRILVCGIGNRIMGDDGFAQHVLEFLGNELPDNVESGDFGTASLTIYEFEIKKDDVREDVDALRDLFSFSFHESGLEEMIIFAKKINCLPDRVFLIGCEPGDIKPGLELSKEVGASVAKVANRIIDLIEKLSN
ncbi:MAG: hypothetical protein A7315_00435 [Candidatus Altiarchaeales archaeon WOR_SM1_79]|nr:MAG: hypothetical protein A7315_00435 [Candidatus Altiarchaeales archaeon WOR_SM1_79]